MPSGSGVLPSQPASARVSCLRLFGFGLTVAVLGDSTLVRMLLVPAFMHVLGRVNWCPNRWPACTIGSGSTDDGRHGR
jgi:uncharacterized membrane protein YdfJ with MMPL/SSD domain